MDFLPEEIEAYAERFTEAESPLLAELNRYTHANVLMPRMLAGHLQGRVLAMLSAMIQPKLVVEIGTYTGYSALCWAEGVADGGMVHTIEVNDELESKIKSFIDRSELRNKITLHIGPALKIIPGIQGEIDLAYIDADKENYSNYFDALIDKVSIGGYIIADNVLWSGKITADPAKMDYETKCLYEYSKKVHEDERVQNVLLPIRDGLMIARKVK
ncbi:MAG: class I SAM-dependent methyltransferase [Flavobacteriales bacterium]